MEYIYSKISLMWNHENWSLKTYNGIIKSDIFLILSKFCSSNENIFLFLAPHWALQTFSMF